MEKKKVLVVGSSGRMGKLICELITKSEDFVVAAGYDKKRIPSLFTVYTSIDELPVNSNFDLIIDFSNPSATMEILPYALDLHIPMVIATTGFTAEQEESISEHYAKCIPIFKSSNMSYGVAATRELLKLATKLFVGYDIEINEFHHRGKKDSPSGTAKLFFDTINEFSSEELVSVYGRTEKREPNEVGMSSQRGGSFPGTHSVTFAGDNDCIELKHTAFTPSIFAEGAIEAARYIAEQTEPHIYTMDDLLRL